MNFTQINNEVIREVKWFDADDQTEEVVWNQLRKVCEANEDAPGVMEGVNFFRGSLIPWAKYIYAKNCS